MMLSYRRTHTEPFLYSMITNPYENLTSDLLIKLSVEVGLEDWTTLRVVFPQHGMLTKIITNYVRDTVRALKSEGIEAYGHGTADKAINIVFRGHAGCDAVNIGSGVNAVGPPTGVYGGATPTEDSEARVSDKPPDGTAKARSGKQRRKADKGGDTTQGA